MKIAVLFGSFNPMTNAHVSAMKAAMKGNALLPSAVAPLFRKVMEEPGFKSKFKLLVFAILERPRRPQGLDGKFAPFYEEFGSYSIINN